MATATSPALKADTVYIAHDRFVCVDCAGYTAEMTGRTPEGVRLVRATAADAAEWASYDLGPLVCECGRVTFHA